MWAVPSPMKSAGVCGGEMAAGRIIRWEELGDGVSVVGTESGGWWQQDYLYNLP